LISLLDLAIKLRNISFFILILKLLIRVTIDLDYTITENKIKKITGPWLDALRYVYDKIKNKYYDEIIGD
jgi:hypothetical protein